MTSIKNAAPLHAEYPPKADLRKDLNQPLPFVAPGTVDVSTVQGDAVNAQASAVLRCFNEALEESEPLKLTACFYESQAYWKDMVAMTAHLRTFTTPKVIAAALLSTAKLRELVIGLQLESARFVPVSPVLAEDQQLLKQSQQDLKDAVDIEIDALIIGGGNAGISLAARLKALNVVSIVIDKNAEVGDNWATRYACLQFHVPTSSCEMPFLCYDETLQSPHLLNRNDLSGHLKRYVEALKLNVINSAEIQSTVYDKTTKQWTVEFRTPSKNVRVVCKQLVQATGFGSGKPYIPDIPNVQLYGGINIHSAQYGSAGELAEQGAKSVMVVGSANTAFDILEDCHSAGLQTTMIARSPTYVFPVSYVFDPHSLGACDHLSTEEATEMLMTLPVVPDTQLARGLFSHLSSLEPDRYAALAAAGFPVIDSRHPHADLQHHLVERVGGHYVDMGQGVRLISEGKVGVRGNVEPVAFTHTGMRLSDGSKVEADAVIWCTGFADKDSRSTVAQILGGGVETKVIGGTNNEKSFAEQILGPQDVAALLDITWGVDKEGEVRGMWKRHLRMENFWTFGGTMQHQRWWSRVLAQQIKLALHDALPLAYRETPEPVGED